MPSRVVSAEPSGSAKITYVGGKRNAAGVLGDEALHVPVQRLLDGCAPWRFPAFRLCLPGNGSEKEKDERDAERGKGRGVIASDHGNCLRYAT